MPSAVSILPATLMYIASQECWIDCHQGVTNNVDLPGKDTNFYAAITRNCEWPVCIHIVYIGYPYRD